MLTQSRNKPPPRLLRLFLLGLGATVIQVGSAPDPALAQGATIGIYSDQSGNICSFSGNSPGTFTAYVVCRPNLNGVRAVQFAAPLPSCLGAVIEEEILPTGALAIGSVETGISIVLPLCSALPATVLKIIYSRTGSTTPCCEYPIVADPGPGVLSTVDCAGVEVSTTGVVSHFNADASCPCAGNSQPSIPENPIPNDFDVGQSVTTGFSWSASDIDGNLAEYDLYLGTSSSPPLVAAGLTQPGYILPSPLEPLTRYYWRVVARDALGLETSGFVWTFTTRLVNSPPPTPRPVNPEDGATDVPLDVDVVWMSFDIDNDPLVYDLYFGASPDPPLIATDLATPTYSPATLSYETNYYWRVVARDPLGHEAPSPVWTFLTRVSNYPPNPPVNLLPHDQSTGQPVTLTLTWSATDPENDPMVFDVYVGLLTQFPPVPPPERVATGLTTMNHSLTGLAFSTSYFWHIVARDDRGRETPGPDWIFKTRPENYPPTAPSSPSPANGATNQAVTSTLAWQSTDADGHALSYDVYFGTATPLSLVASNVATNAYAPGLLAYATTYRWRIVARDEMGATTSGPLWSFSSRVANHPPNAPSSPLPPNGATNRPVTGTLAWQCSDSDGDAITYDVYFGTASPPPLVASNVATKAYVPGTLAFTTTYRWKIVARDAPGAETSGPIWSFTTKANSAPNTPSNPSPPNNGTSPLSPVLSWTVTDPDGQPITHSVYFGTTSPPPLVASGLTSTTYAPGTLDLLTQYFWRVVASDGVLSTSGPTWTFTAGGGSVPVLFTRFEAVLEDGAVDVRWELTNDEAMESFTLYRREGVTSLAGVIAHGPVNSGAGSHFDRSTEAAKTYRYEMLVRTRDGEAFRSPVATVTTPTSMLVLGQNHPNPFNPQTTIPYELPKTAQAVHARLVILDTAGHVVRTLVDENQWGGARQAVWDGRNDVGSSVSSGVYFYVLDAGGERRTRKLVLLK